MKLLLRPLVLGLAVFGFLNLLSRFLGISRFIPFWAMAIIASLLIEAIVRLYRYESRAIPVERARVLLTLRIAACSLLAFILIDPTLVREVPHEIEQEVVILIDDSASMGLIDEGQEQSRYEIGARALRSSRLEQILRQKLSVRTLYTGRSPNDRAASSSEGESPEASTDLAAALDAVLDQIPSQELAGVVMLTDGRHNGPGRVEDYARRFGIIEAPIGIVALGSDTPPKDAAILSVSSPDAIHLGDRMRLSVQTLFHGYAGQKATVGLFQGEKLLESKLIEIPQDNHREEIRFAQIPEEGGINNYRVEITGLENERFPENNIWNFETSITDARTHVLLIDSYPRWEFRYLRNLFYGRDKSIHLQYLLLNPDKIADQITPAIPASADRPFGDAMASRLPANEEEWKKFDVIIIGDVGSDALRPSDWDIISRCVKDRAAALILVSGQRFMPHDLAEGSARSLSPVEMEWGKRTYFQNNTTPFKFAVTSAGRNHPITQQESGISSSVEDVWKGFPQIKWRHPLTDIREGAEVLLTAIPPDELGPATNPGDLEEALLALAEKKERETKNALLVTRQTGSGKVALLLTDRTWRLREGAGDVFHHRFWGNLIKWGSGPILRAGNDSLRLGTDRLSYTRSDKPIVMARLRNADLSPIHNAAMKAEIRDDQDQIIDSVPLKYVENSNGLYEAELRQFENTGHYHIRLAGPDLGKLPSDASDVSVGFRVISSRGPVELAETELNLPLMHAVADLSGGKVVRPEQISSLASLFINKNSRDTEIREIKLWDNLWLFITFAILLSGEWILRRSSGLP
ncbi:hypothetical protein ACFSSA_02365 [Luteolibacter algae]|uniref:VWFA domain-containing protein n=1 Tax=Luteolibacter algae TaxID=454151 RepID=A0ABW5D3Y1_9BACT